MIGVFLLIDWLIVWKLFFHEQTTSVEVHAVRRFTDSSYTTIAILALWSLLAWLYARQGLLPIEIVLSAALTLSGQLLMVLARRRLPLSNYDLFFRVSDSMTRGGIYAWVGHPMYIGLVVALIGSSLLLKNIPALYVAVFVVIPTLWFRARAEHRS